MLGFLPWEKWLPPYVFGPLLCIGSGWVLFFSPALSWWKISLCVFGIVFGAIGTGIWFATRRNVFDASDGK